MNYNLAAVVVGYVWTMDHAATPKRHRRSHPHLADRRGLRGRVHQISATGPLKNAGGPMLVRARKGVGGV